MPIQYYEPPAASLQALRAAAETVPVSYEHVATMMHEVLVAPGQHWPHPVWRVGLQDMAAENGLKTAKMVGWRFLSHSGKNRNYALEVQMEQEAGSKEAKYQFAEVDKGPYIDGIFNLLLDESLQQKIGTEIFRLAVLRLNALGVFAVWLQPREPKRALLIPLAPTPRCLEKMQPYTINQFQDALRERANEKLAN